MLTLTGFTRPADPVWGDQLATMISTALGKTVTCLVTAGDIQVTGNSLLSGDMAVIQAAMSAYVYVPPNLGNVMVGDSDATLSANSDTHISTEKALKTYIDGRVGTKTTIRYYLNGVAQNGTAATGDIVEWIETVTTASGVTTSYITTEGTTRTSGGTALLSTLFPDSIQTNFIDSTGVYAQGVPTVTSNKTVSIPFTKQGFNGVTVVTINVLGSVAMNAIPNGVTVKLRLVGIAA